MNLFPSTFAGGDGLPVLVWRFALPLRAISSAPLGGGLGVRRWMLNAQVPSSYDRPDPARHLRALATSAGLAGVGVGMLTAADVHRYVTTDDGGVEVTATVGLGMPTLAAAPEPLVAAAAGTINALIIVPERLADAALVNAVATATEAKAQALRDLGIDATGTPTDALCVACPVAGRSHAYGGPRSVWGARIARAMHAAVITGGERR